MHPTPTELIAPAHTWLCTRQPKLCWIRQRLAPNTEENTRGRGEEEEERMKEHTVWAGPSHLRRCRREEVAAVGRADPHPQPRGVPAAWEPRRSHTHLGPTNKPPLRQSSLP